MSIQLQNFVSLTTTGTSGASTLTNGVLNVPNYATSGGTWVDYSATSTIVGWSSFTTKIIKYRVIDKQLFCLFYLEGTSNSVNTTFTLPNNSLTYNELAGRYANNGAVTAGYIRITNASNVMTFLSSIISLTWTASGTKSISGQFFYDIA